MSTLRVIRPNDFGGRYRGLVVEVDGQRIGALHPNHRLEIQLAPGTHQVSGRMDWARSEPLGVDGTGVADVVTVELSMPFRAIIDAFFRPRQAIRARLLA